MKKVLIVEDDPIWADLLQRYIDGLAKCKVVISGAQAIEAFDDWQPDALVLDMLLAGETGMALLNELKSYGDTAKLPVVVCSSVDINLGQLTPFGVKAVLNKNKMLPAEARATLKKVLS